MGTEMSFCKFIILFSLMSINLFGMVLKHSFEIYAYRSPHNPHCDLFCRYRFKLGRPHIGQLPEIIAECGYI